MYMTDEEISRSYRQADNRRNQLIVLADLNAVNRATMLEKLVELGLETPVMPRRRKALSHVDDVRARNLWAGGAYDEDIAQQLGVSLRAVQAWRYREKLKVNHKPIPGRKKKEETAVKKSSSCPAPECAVEQVATEQQRTLPMYMTAAALRDVVARICELHPDALCVLGAGGDAVRAATVTVSYDQLGEIVPGSVLLRLEV